jgi:hypothetical protein
MTRKPGPARRSLAEAAASSVLRRMKIDGLWVDPESNRNQQRHCRKG